MLEENLKIVPANEKQRHIPQVAVDDDGNVCYDHDYVLSKWKHTNEALFDRSTLTDCPSDFNEFLPANSLDTYLLNKPISGIKIERAVFRLKNGKFTGIDDIPAEVLNNSSSVDLLDRIIKYCFENGTIPSIWGP